MANENPANKGEQVKGGPPIVENAQLPRMGEAKLPENTINGAVRRMTMGAQPAGGTNLMAPVPEHQMPQQGAGGKQAYQPTQRKPREQQPAPNEGDVRLQMHVANGQMSVTGAQAVAGPLGQTQSLQQEQSYEA